MEEEIFYITGGYEGKVVLDDSRSSLRPAACWNYGRKADTAPSIKRMIPGTYQDSRGADDFSNFFCFAPAEKSVAGYSKR